MNTSSSRNTIFSLPKNQIKARQVFYAIMLAGVFFVPLTMLVYQRFIAPKTGISTKEFFLLFSAAYILLFILFSAASARASSALRKKLSSKLPRDVMVVAPAAANSNVPEIVKLGRRYWIWQLMNSYFSGMAFSWLACIFFLFIIRR